MREIRALLLIGLLLSATRPLAAEPPAIYEHMVGNWEVSCSKEVCLVMLYITNGAGDDTTVVKIDKVTMKPENFGIMITGDIKKEHGFAAQFVKTEVDSTKPECVGGPEAPKPSTCYSFKLLANKVFNGLFSDCDEQRCFAKIPGQYIGDKGTPGQIDLLKEYENDNSLLVIWNDKKDNLKRVMLDIDGFTQAYDTAISVLNKQK